MEEVTKKEYSQEYKDQIVKEAIEVGNVTLVVRKNGICQKTLNNWVQMSRGTEKVRSVGSSRQVRKEIDTNPVQRYDDECRIDYTSDEGVKSVTGRIRMVQLTTDYNYS